MIDGIQKVVGDCREVVVLDVSKVDAVSANKLRLALRQKNIRLLGVKNAVARRALGQIGLSGVGASLVGPSTLAFGGEDIVALSRELTEWAKKIKALKCGADDQPYYGKYSKDYFTTAFAWDMKPKHLGLKYIF